MTLSTGTPIKPNSAPVGALVAAIALRQPRGRIIDRKQPAMTEERACHYAKVLARGMGVTFYAVRSREGRFLAVQSPSDGCDILKKVTPPASAHHSRQFRVPALVAPAERRKRTRF